MVLGLIEVKLIAEATLPPHRNLEVLAEPQKSADNGTTWLMEEKSGNQNSILVARAVVTLSSNKMVMCFLNSCSETVTIKG